MDPGTPRGTAALRVGLFELEVRWSWSPVVAAYLFAGVLTAVAGGHVELDGRDGIALGAVAFAVLALAAALVHELGHAVTGLAFGRRPVGLVLKAGAAIRIEEARPGSRGSRAWAECLVALGGPVASGLTALAYLQVSRSVGSPFAWAGLLALFDGAINLVPVIANSDGNRVLRALMTAWRDRTSRSGVVPTRPVQLGTETSGPGLEPPAPPAAALATPTARRGATEAGTWPPPPSP